jgi:ubiquinone/menaquinone biosynthesis C-methylase UbiE
MNPAKSVFRVSIKIAAVLMLYLCLARIARKFLHFPAPSFVGYFLDSNLRRALQPPEPIIERSGIEPGMQVLEIGCGSGAYTTHVARAVGEQGEVSALDIQPAMLRQLERKLRRPENQDLGNIRLFEGNAYRLPFDDETFDVAYMITSLPEIPDQRRALLEARRVLKTDGWMAVTEFLPDPDYPLRSTTVKLGQSAGFLVDEVSGNLWTYTVRFKKSV